jgi:hypothetical protein
LPEPLLFYREAATGQARNYLMSCRAARRVYRLYGPKIVGRLATTLLCLKSLIKSGVYRVGTLLGLESRLIAKRNRPLSEAEAAGAKTILDQILGTAVPGLASRTDLPTVRKDCKSVLSQGESHAVVTC